MADTAVASRDHGGVGDAWWIPLVMGIVAVLFGVLLLTHPKETAVWVTFLVGFWWLSGGVIQLVALFADRTMWGWKLASGILGLLAGFLVLDAASSTPLLAAVGLAAIYVIIIGIQGILIGVIDIIRAFQGGGWGIGIIGMLSILFGGLLLFNPLVGVVALPVVFGVLAVVFGGAAIVMGFKLRSI